MGLRGQVVCSDSRLFIDAMAGNLRLSSAPASLWSEVLSGHTC